MRLKPIVTALCAGALLAASPFASAKELKAIGVTVGDLANPFFVQITKGAELEARKLAGDNVKVTLVSSGYDLGQQVAQIDNFIAAKIDMIILNAADSKGIGPAVKRAKEAGIVVVAVDVAAEGATSPSLAATMFHVRSSRRVSPARCSGRSGVFTFTSIGGSFSSPVCASRFLLRHMALSKIGCRNGITVPLISAQSPRA